NNDKGLFHWTPEGAAQITPWAQLGHKYGAVALLPDRLQGGLWLGFFDGGIAHLKEGQIGSSYNVAHELGNGPVNDLQLGSDGAVWAATEGGLSRVKDGVVTTLTSSNGLPCDAVNSVIEDNDHSFWLYMACGLVRIARPELDAWVSDSKRSVQTTVFDSSDGVRTRALAGGHSRLVAKSPDGKIWFSPPDGISFIDPRHLPFNPLPPPVYVQQITADGKRYDASPGLRLPPRVRDLSIDYTALSLVAPEKVRFRFKLEGQDADWREVVNQRHVEYSNLPPANYRFRVTACNNSGVWNEQGAALDFAIAPAYWQTNWFRVLCVLAFLAIFWTIYQLRVRALEQRQAVLERHQVEIRALNEQMIKAQEAERMRISGELHDGVLQQITSLTLRLGKVKRQVPPDSEATATVSGLQQQLIKIGTDIRHLSHELHPAVLQDAGLPAALCAYCEEFSKIREIPVSCETDESVQELSPGAALCLYRIAQEALGNAAKYSEAKKVEVRLTRSDGRVWLSVSDDGVGCTPNQIAKSGGLGLINMRERVHQLNGTFDFDSQPGRGTTVRVTVPFRAAS
ncbi:MAG: ATP-binding protein, partial [Candidatus Korobacteraceae bacterium]